MKLKLCSIFLQTLIETLKIKLINKSKKCNSDFSFEDINILAWSFCVLALPIHHLNTYFFNYLDFSNNAFALIFAVLFFFSMFINIFFILWHTFYNNTSNIYKFLFILIDSLEKKRYKFLFIFLSMLFYSMFVSMFVIGLAMACLNIDKLDYTSFLWLRFCLLPYILLIINVSFYLFIKQIKFSHILVNTFRSLNLFVVIGIIFGTSLGYGVREYFNASPTSSILIKGYANSDDLKASNINNSPELGNLKFKTCFAPKNVSGFNIVWLLNKTIIGKTILVDKFNINHKLIGKISVKAGVTNDSLWQGISPIKVLKPIEIDYKISLAEAKLENNCLDKVKSEFKDIIYAEAYNALSKSNQIALTESKLKGASTSLKIDSALYPKPIDNLAKPIEREGTLPIDSLYQSSSYDQDINMFDYIDNIYKYQEKDLIVFSSPWSPSSSPIIYTEDITMFTDDLTPRSESPGISTDNLTARPDSPVISNQDLMEISDSPANIPIDNLTPRPDGSSFYTVDDTLSTYSSPPVIYTEDITMFTDDLKPKPSKSRFTGDPMNIDDTGSEESMWAVQEINRRDPELMERIFDFVEKYPHLSFDIRQIINFLPVPDEKGCVLPEVIYMMDGASGNLLESKQVIDYRDNMYHDKPITTFIWRPNSYDVRYKEHRTIEPKAMPDFFLTLDSGEKLDLYVEFEHTRGRWSKKTFCRLTNDLYYNSRLERTSVFFNDEYIVLPFKSVVTINLDYWVVLSPRCYIYDEPQTFMTDEMISSFPPESPIFHTWNITTNYLKFHWLSGKWIIDPVDITFNKTTRKQMANRNPPKEDKGKGRAIEED